MAKPGHQQQETSANDGAPSKSGGRQAVVELCEISTGGLVFWSRSRFEIGAEVQVRMKRTALPAQWQAEVVCCPWVMLKGLVVACPPQRKEDGSSGFAVTLLIEADGDGPVQPAKVRSKMRWSRRPMPWLRRFGLN